MSCLQRYRVAIILALVFLFALGLVSSVIQARPWAVTLVLATLLGMNIVRLLLFFFKRRSSATER